MKTMDLSELQNIIELIKSTDAIQKSIKICNMYLDKAYVILNTLPENETKKMLGHNVEVYRKKKILIFNVNICKVYVPVVLFFWNILLRKWGGLNGENIFNG